MEYIKNTILYFISYLDILASIFLLISYKKIGNKDVDGWGYNIIGSFLFVVWGVTIPYHVSKTPAVGLIILNAIFVVVGIYNLYNWKKNI